MQPDNTHHLASQENTFIQYHLGQKNQLPTSRDVVLTQLWLIFGGLVALQYWIPAGDYSGDYPTGKTLTPAQLKIGNILGTCIPLFTICYEAARMFLEQHVKQQHIPHELTDIISAPLSQEQYRSQNFRIGLLGAMAAIPFATTSAVYPPAGITVPEFVLYIMTVFIIQAILHFLPVKLTLAHPKYGFLTRRLQQLSDYLCQRQLSAATLASLNDKQALDARKTRLIETLNPAKHVLLSSLMTRLGQVNQNELNRILAMSSQELLQHWLSCNNNTTQSESNSIKAWALFTAGAIGSSIELLGSLGFAANPVIVIIDKTPIPLGLVIAFTPLLFYFFILLLVFFGEIYGQRILNDFLLSIDSLRQGTSKNLPIELQLYPRLFSGLLLFNSMLIPFSAAAALEMNHFAFAGLTQRYNCGWAMAVLNFFAIAGAYIFAWYGPLDFQKTMVKNIAQHGLLNLILTCINLILAMPNFIYQQVSLKLDILKNNPSHPEYRLLDKNEKLARMDSDSENALINSSHILEEKEQEQKRSPSIIDNKKKIIILDEKLQALINDIPRLIDENVIQTLENAVSVNQNRNLIISEDSSEEKSLIFPKYCFSTIFYPIPFQKNKICSTSTESINNMM